MQPWYKEHCNDTQHKKNYYKLYYGKGSLIEAKEHLKKGVDFVEKINQPVIATWAYDFLAETYYAMGEFKRSQEQWEKAISLLKKNSLYPTYVNLYSLAQARIKSRQGKNFDLASLREDAHVMKLKGYIN